MESESTPGAGAPQAPPPGDGERSSTGLETNVAGTLCYALGFVSGIAFLMLENDSRTVRFHALQSTLTFGGLLALQLVAGWVPLLGPLIAMLVSPVALILWIVLMVKAYRSELLELPVVGDIAADHAGI